MGLVRFFLALVVAVDHWRVIVLHEKWILLDDVVKFGFNAGYAVMFFYVISGFLITYTLTRNYKRDRSGVAAFYSNRFIRIFSLYWPMVILAFIFVASAWPQFVAASLPDKFTAYSCSGWIGGWPSVPTRHPLGRGNKRIESGLDFGRRADVLSAGAAFHQVVEDRGRRTDRFLRAFVRSSSSGTELTCRKCGPMRLSARLSASSCLDTWHACSVDTWRTGGWGLPSPSRPSAS